MQTEKKRPPRRRGPKNAQFRLPKMAGTPPKPPAGQSIPGLFLPGQGYAFGAPIDGEE
jgi:hypothetical protein